MGKQKRATWFKVFLHQKAVFDALSDEDVGSGFKAAMQYFETGEASNCMTLGASIVLMILSKSIEEAVNDFETASNFGKRGASKRWKGEEECQTNN